MDTRVKFRFQLAVLSAFFLATIVATSAQAGVFEIPRTVKKQSFAAGVETEFTFSGGSGVGFNGMFSYGITDSWKASLHLGHGTETRQFRVGGAGTFEIFPDVGGQPGIGVAGKVLYVRNNADSGHLAITGIPYVMKTFRLKVSQFSPYLAVPLGVSINGGVNALTTVVFGSYFKTIKHFRWVGEIGVAINNGHSYVSGGFIYYH